MTTGDTLNLLAIIIIPLLAVWLGKFLQDRSELRRDRMECFKSVMTFRYGWSPEGVKALNNIHIVFSDEEDVRKCWRNYYKELNVMNPTEEDLLRRESSMYELIESKRLI